MLKWINCTVNSNCSVYCLNRLASLMWKSISETPVGCTASYFVNITWCSCFCFVNLPPPLFWGCVLLYLQSAEGGLFARYRMNCIVLLQFEINSSHSKHSSQAKKGLKWKSYSLNFVFIVYIINSTQRCREFELIRASRGTMKHAPNKLWCVFLRKYYFKIRQSLWLSLKVILQAFCIVNLDISKTIHMALTEIEIRDTVFSLLQLHGFRQCPIG